MNDITYNALEAMVRVGDAEYCGEVSIFSSPTDSNFKSGECFDKTPNSLPQTIYEALLHRGFVIESSKVNGQRYRYLSREGRELYLHIKKIELQLS